MQPSQLSDDDMDISDDDVTRKAKNSNEDTQMDKDRSVPTNQNIEGDSENGNEKAPFRTKSLLLSTFPWFSCIPMVQSKLVDPISERDHPAFVRRFLQ